MAVQDIIVINPKIKNGVPIIKGTRIPVSVIKDLLKTSSVEFVARFYHLSHEQVNACKKYVIEK